MKCSPQAPLSMGFPRQEYMSCHLLLQGIFLTHPGIKSCLLCLLYWQEDFLPLVPPGTSVKPFYINIWFITRSENMCNCSLSYSSGRLIKTFFLLNSEHSESGNYSKLTQLEFTHNKMYWIANTEKGRWTLSELRLKYWVPGYSSIKSTWQTSTIDLN